MDGNKDEAERCLEYAEKFAEQGLKEKAEKFIQKAERLFPTERAKTLLANLEKMQTNQGRKGSEDEPFVRQRTSASANKENSPSGTHSTQHQTLSKQKVLFSPSQSQVRPRRHLPITRANKLKQ
jgi:DnaJ homolog subfamily B member 12